MIDLGVSTIIYSPAGMIPAMDSIGHRLEELRREAGLTKVAMAEAGNTSKQHYGRIVDGLIKQPAPELLGTWARHFGVRLEWLASGKGDKQELAGNLSDWLPALGFKQAAGLGHGQRADEWAEAHGLMFRRSFYSKINARPKDCAIFYGKGDSMAPTIQDGDAFLFVTTDTTPRKGNIYLLHMDNATDSKEYNVKRCVGAGMFAADNPDGDHDWKEPRALGPGDVVLGRVRWIGRMVK